MRPGKGIVCVSELQSLFYLRRTGVVLLTGAFIFQTTMNMLVTTAERGELILVRFGITSVC